MTVETVLGRVQTDQLGVTLMHEHLLVDASHWWHEPEPTDARRQAISRAPVSVDHLGVLRNDPFLSRDNIRLEDEDIAIEEVSRFRDAGGATIVDPTCRGIGRNPAALQRISRATGLNVVIGAGYYLEPAHPPSVRRMSIDDIAVEIERDVREGADESDVRAGLIGEIGVSRDFTTAEQKVLRAAARAQHRTKVPLAVHLPGWERLGSRVLDTIAEEGGDVGATILCHMNPSQRDLGYQCGLADRGAWIEYDMIGMDYFFADQQAQCPCDQENADAICGLVRAGYGERVLLSGDVFLKTMLVRYGGFGYAHVLENFVPRLRRHGLDDGHVDQMLVLNPRALFEAAAS